MNDLDLSGVTCAGIYPVDREQWIGYTTGYLELKGERVTFVTIAAGFPKHEGEMISSWQATPEAAWDAFDLGLKAWLAERPGLVLWRREPELQRQTVYVLDTFSSPTPRLVPEDRYIVFARIAVTQNRAFVPEELPV